MIDFHSHILPGVDDGPKELAGSISIATALAKAGFKEVYCTPHMIRGAYDNQPENIRSRVDALQDAVNQNGIGLKLYPGMEYYLDEYLPAIIQEPLPLHNAAFILVELPQQTTFHVVESLTSKIISRGFTPLIAHPERSPVLTVPDKKRGGGIFGSSITNLFSRSSYYPSGTSPVDTLLSKGCRFQGNIGSFAGMYGERVRAIALGLLERGAYSCLGSDAHRPERLAETLESGLLTIRRKVGSGTSEQLLRGELLDK